jgi:hypothetical protein
VFRSPLERATPLFGGMAARGGAGETGGSQEDSDAEGDPSFDLMETNAKRNSVLSSVLNGPLVNRSGRLCSTKETANW